MKKNTYLAISSSYQWVDFFVYLWAERIGVDSCGFNTKTFSVCLRNKQGFYFFSLLTIQVSKKHRLIN